MPATYSNILIYLPGARHLYLADYDPTNLPELKATIQKTYPDVKVGLFTSPHVTRSRSTVPTQVTVQQADAADEDAVAGLCKKALHDEGRLDVFFANVRRILLRRSTNAHVAQGWDCPLRSHREPRSEAVHGDYARQLTIVRNRAVITRGLRLSRAKMPARGQTCFGSDETNEPVSWQRIQWGKHHPHRIR